MRENSPGTKKPGEVNNLRRSLLRVVPNPLILASTVADSNKVGAVPSRFGGTHGEWPISPASSLDLLPVIDILICHPFPPRKAMQGSAIATKNVAFSSRDGSSTIGWDEYSGGGEGGIRTHGRVSPTH